MPRNTYARQPNTVAYVGFLPSSWTTLWTFEGTFNSRAILQGMYLCNTGSTAASFSLALRSSGGTIGDDDWLMMTLYELDPYETYYLSARMVDGIVLENGDTIDAFASVADQITTRICVEEQI